MAVRVKYHRTELSEGEVEMFPDADRYEILDDNTVILKALWDDNKIHKIGAIHPGRWESVSVVFDDADIAD